MDNHAISLKLPLKTDLLLPVRLFVGGVANIAGFSIEDIEDLKVAVQEACIILHSCGYQNVVIDFSLQEEIAVCIRGENLHSFQNGNKTGMQIISALVDSVEYDKERLSFVVLHKKLR